MSDDVVISSTTDTQEQVNAAAGYGTTVVTSRGTPEPEPEPVPSEGEQPETDTDSEPVEEEPKSEPEGEEEPELEQRGLVKSKKKLLRQVNRLTGQKYALQEQLDEAMDRLRKYERPAGTTEARAATAPASDEPVPSQYGTYEEYVKALAKWTLTQERQAQTQAEQNDYLKQVFDEYNHQVEDARDTHDDFDEVVNQAVAVPVVAINTMYEMDNGAEVAYYLGQHPEVRDQLLEWNQPGTKGGIRKIVVELNKISDQLGGGSTPTFSPAGNGSNGSQRSSKPRTVTTAPAPIKPVGGASSARSTVRPDEMDFQAYKKWRGPYRKPR